MILAISKLGADSMFNNYPDIVSIEQIMAMLNLGKSSVYSLLKSSHIRHVRVGRKYIIPKQSVIDFLAYPCDNIDTIIDGRLINQS